MRCGGDDASGARRADGFAPTSRSSSRSSTGSRSPTSTRPRARRSRGRCSTRCATSTRRRTRTSTAASTSSPSGRPRGSRARAREGARAPQRARRRARSSSSRNATEGINLVAYAWGLDNLGPGDLVLVTELEHHSNFVPWQYIAERTGAEFRMIPLDDTGELVLDGLDEIARDGQREGRRARTSSRTRSARSTRSSGSPSGRTSRARSSSCDAAQAAPHRPVDVQALGCDFLAFSGAQDVRAERHRRPLGPRRAARARWSRSISAGT